MQEEVAYEQPTYIAPVLAQPALQSPVPARPTTTDQVKSIHKAADATIDWTELLCNPPPPDDSYNEDMWRYYHSVVHHMDYSPRTGFEAVNRLDD